MNAVQRAAEAARVSGQRGGHVGICNARLAAHCVTVAVTVTQEVTERSGI